MPYKIILICMLIDPGKDNIGWTKDIPFQTPCYEQARKMSGETPVGDLNRGLVMITKATCIEDFDRTRGPNAARQPLPGFPLPDFLLPER